MGKYLCSGEIDRTKTSLSPKKRGESSYMQKNMVKQGVEKDTIKNWGDLFVNTMDTRRSGD